MTGTPDWTGLITDAISQYPRFPRATIERLVGRTAREFERSDNLQEAVRDAVLRQLHYIDEPDSLPPLQTARRTLRNRRVSRLRSSLRGHRRPAPGALEHPTPSA